MDLGRLEARLAVACQAVVGGHPEVDRHHPFADQAMGQVAGNIGLGLARHEVAAGGLDGQRQGPPQVPERQPFPFRHRAAEHPELFALAEQTGPVAVGRRPFGVGQLGDESRRVMVPGTLLELKAEAGQFFLEDPGTLDVVRQDGAGLPVDEHGDRRGVRRKILPEIPPGREPGDRVRPGQDDGVVTQDIQKRDQMAVFLVDLSSSPGDLGVEVVGRRVDQGGQRVFDGPIFGRHHNPVKGRQIVMAPDSQGMGEFRGKTVQWDLGRHVVTSLGPSWGRVGAGWGTRPQIVVGVVGTCFI